MTFKAAIFDMDGTILDTIEDLAAAVNHSLDHFGFNGSFSPEETKAFFCNGARHAISSALAASGAISGHAKAGNKKAEDDLVDQVLDYYRPWYASHSDIRTGPYPGVLDLLKELRAAGVKTAVVSNKPDPAVQKLCRVYFPDVFDFALGEIEGIPRKPEPDMIRLCLEKLDVTPEQAVYIGDSEVDIETASASGLFSICVDWGFRQRDALAGADRIVSDCHELARAILSSDK